MSESAPPAAERAPAYDPEYANSNRNLATSLAGSSIAILTFAMFFLFDRAEAGAFDPVLFQITIGDLVAATFLFGYSGIYFYWIMEAQVTQTPPVRRHVLYGDVCFILGLSLLMIGPAMILFTARLPYLGAFAVALWIGMMYLVLFGGRRSH